MGVKVHHDIIAHLLWYQRSRGTTRDDTKKVIPASNDSSTVNFNELLQSDAHLLFHSARVVDMSTDIEELGATVPLATKPKEPLSTSPADGWSHSNSLHIGDSGGAAKHSNISWEWRLQPGLSLLAFQGLDESSFLSTDVGTSSTVHKQVKVIPTATCIGSQEPCVISLLDGHLKVASLVVELSSDVDVASPSSHGSSSYQASFNQGVGVMAHNLAILASSRLAFICVDHQILWPSITGFVHE